jgi:Chaperone of endosialidase/Domain of unknown function (DUF5011)
MQSFVAALLLFLTSIFGGHHTVTVHVAPNQPHATSTTQTAAVFNAAVASLQTPAATAASAPPHQPLAVAKTSAPSSVQDPITHAPTAVLAASVSPASYVTEDELTAQLQIAENNLRNLIFANTNGGAGSQVGEGQYASGGIINEIAATNKIDQLNGTTLNNVTVNGISGITASDIPTNIVAVNYLPLVGGTLTGALINSGTATSSFIGALGIGTSSPSDLFALNGAAYIADITPPANTTNRLYSNAGSLYWAGNLLGGATTGNWTSDGTNLWRTGGNVGIGTTSPFDALSVNGGGYISALTLGSPLSIASGGTGGADAPTVRSNFNLDRAVAVDSIARLRSFGAGSATTPTINVQSYYGPTASTPNYGGGTFVWSSSSTAADDGCSIINYTGNAGAGRWVRVWDQPYITPQDCGAIGDGVHDDGPSFRTAISIGIARNFAEVLIPAQSVAYYLQSLDPSGLGVLVIGDGTSHASINLVGEAVNTSGGYNGGVNIKLGAGLNRPLLYVRKEAASPVLRNLRLDGNGSAQSGWSGGPNSRLFTVQIEDDPSPSIESSLEVYNTWLVGGYNGNLYLGSGRGTLIFKDSWSQYSGQTSSDMSVLLNGYDSDFDNSQIGPNTGVGLWVNEGSQYFISNSAIFENYVGEVIGSGKVGYIVHTGVNYQSNATNAIQTSGGSLSSGQGAGSVHEWIGAIFDGNSTAGSGQFSDVLATNDPYASFVAPNFVGDESTTGPFPKYNIQISGASKVVVDNPTYIPGSSATVSFTNSPSSVVLNNGWTSNATGLYNNNAGNVGIGTSSPWGLLSIAGAANSTTPLFAIFTSTASATSTAFFIDNKGFVGVGTSNPLNNFAVAAPNQFGGLSLFNSGSNPIAKLIGSGVNNDNGSLQLYNGGTVRTNLTALGTSYLLGGNVGIGTTTPDQLLALYSATTPSLEFSADAVTQWTAGIDTSDGNKFKIASSTAVGTNARLTIDATGKVGIGTTNPSAKLQVDTASQFDGIFVGNGTNIVGSITGTTVSNDNGLMKLLSGGSANVVLRASGVSYLNGGNVGVGTTTPNVRLDVTDTSTVGAVDFMRLSNNLMTRYMTFGIISGAGNTRPYIQSHFNNDSNNWDFLLNPLGGNVGIGTTSPDMLLSVGSATPTGSVAHFENSTGSCYINPTTTSLSCSSDARLKKNIANIDASSTLDGVLALDPVDYNWKAEATGTALHAGFIAQSVQLIFPDLVSQGPDGYLTLNYAGFAPYIVKAIQQLYEQLTSLEANVAGFADNFVSAHITVTTLDAGTVTVSDQLCAKKSDGAAVCVTSDQLAALLAAGASGGNQSSGAAQPGPDGTSTLPGSVTQNTAASTTPGTPPVIQINGDNPAIIRIGDAYADLGATITGPQADLNLGIKTFLNGRLVSNIVLDTSSVATDTIDYVATDSAGLTATSTRTVIIEPTAVPPATSPSGAVTASSTGATSTAE